jgi:uncharacterized protein DUF5455
MAVMLGLPWLASGLASLFGGIVSFFATFLTKRIAMVAAVITAVLALLTTFTIAANTAVNTVLASYPVGDFAYGLSLLPSNTDICVSAIVTVRIAGYTYWWMKQVIQYRLF